MLISLGLVKLACPLDCLALYLSILVEVEKETEFSEFDAVKVGEGRMKNQYDFFFSFNTSVV